MGFVWGAVSFHGAREPIFAGEMKKKRVQLLNRRR